ncbi:RNA polymerase subunit sigma-70 [Sorangium sp. So ce542]|uniref:RNA polymerase subunit sigma-70 n=1 Tax=Sorangium sp. So ce542 TaxID=3133316 RepID=UPI003F62378D
MSDHDPAPAPLGGAEKPGAAPAGDREAFERLAAELGPQLRLHCYRILGSLHDAEDALQEGFVRAWRAFDGFEGRGTRKAWLYKIVTNVCLDLASRRKPRALLPEASGPSDPTVPPLPPSPEPWWLEPCPEAWSVEEAVGPEARLSRREGVALAFLAAIQLLPPRQRAVLLMRDVLGWSAEETASLLDVTTSAANSLLSRARATLEAEAPLAREAPWQPPEGEAAELLARYVRAWEANDLTLLAAVLREDAFLTMPPTPTWYAGRDAIVSFAAHKSCGAAGRLRLLPVRANGAPAFVAYRREDDGAFRPLLLQVPSLSPGAVAAIYTFLLPAGAFERYGAPARLPG